MFLFRHDKWIWNRNDRKDSQDSPSRWRSCKGQQRPWCLVFWLSNALASSSASERSAVTSLSIFWPRKWLSESKKTVRLGACLRRRRRRSTLAWPPAFPLVWSIWRCATFCSVYLCSLFCTSVVEEAYCDAIVICAILDDRRLRLAPVFSLTMLRFLLL